MLNEMIDLHDALKKIGCEFGSLHPFFRKCPKGKAAFTLALDEKGIVKDVTPPDFNVEEVYRWKEDNHTPTFPAFNVRAMLEIPSPLPEFSADNEENIHAFIEDLRNPRKAVLKTITEQALMELEAQCNDLWDDDMVWIGKCLKDTPDTIRPMLGEIPKPYQSLEELINRARQCDPKELRESVRSILRKKLLDTGERIYAEAFFAVENAQKKKRRGKEHAKDYLYLLVIDDWSKYPPDSNIDKYPTHHPAIQNWMKSQLELSYKKQHPPTGKPDAYGQDLTGAKDNFAPVDVGGLGPTALFTANDQIPCLKRYGLEGTKLFPAGAEIRASAGKAMAYALDPQKMEGISWKSITKYEPGRNKRKTVVFAYCTELKDTNALQFFDRDDNDADRDIYRSEAATKLALAPFDGIAKERPDAKIVINLLAAVDPGNTKILASRAYSLFELSEGAFRWQAGNANIPRMGLPWITIKGKKGDDGKVSTGNAIPAYPLEAIKLFNSDWGQDGRINTQSKRFTANEALDFLFEADEVIGQRVEMALGLLVEKSARVLISAALKARHDYRSTGNRPKFKDDRFTHMLTSLYGLLLYKRGIKKEDYMNEAVFYLGRYFAVVDDLYIQYHKDVRSGSVPMSLLGNDHMALALQNPLEAFVTLSRRLAHPYLSWAKRVGTDDKPGQIAKNCIKKIAELTEELSKAQLSSTITDVDRAKLLLGYLSYGA